ncbi:pyridoxamine 5'-phosphate oxidase family protein [Haladaptatus sp. DFWS20]|uniref:pyridoxamine 5'-phosphate oxidase family protein n=1 Tax=Haladaptatus sp. DFWS20 TaxID=3403467 RepID=UPI003EB7BBF9
MTSPENGDGERLRDGGERSGSDGKRPGSDGEHQLQEKFETAERALAFYENSMHDHVNETMREFIDNRIMFFLSTADETGETDCSPRIGPEGFVHVLDENRLTYPEFRGNGVHASLGNIEENPHATMLFIDWWDTTVGLHVNGRATLHDEVAEIENSPETDRLKGWVVLEVEEAYIHCAKHIPQLSIEEFDPPWGTDDPEAKQTGFFE